MFRLTSRADPEFLWAMLYEAAFWRDNGADERPEFESLKAERWFARYVEGWGRAGDEVLAATDRNDEPVGAAWYRTFTPDDAGFGFIAADVPEVSIAVYGEFRGRGIGSLLLGSLIVRARAHDVRALSLSVALENPARRLYERVGFVEVGRDDGGSMTMRLDLP
jgi:ribosomal protein S18 acetylase RimI-like enzyme